MKKRLKQRATAHRIRKANHLRLEVNKFVDGYGAERAYLSQLNAKERRNGMVEG